MRVINFSVANFRSFYNKQTINFNVNNNVDAIFGANGAGKSNLYKALDFFLSFTRYSSINNYVAATSRFKLINDNERNTEFEIEFVDDGKQYKYGFQYDDKKIVKEFLSILSNNNRYKTIFQRASVKNGTYDSNGFTRELLKLTRDDTLLLTKAWENNVKIARSVFEAFSRIHMYSGMTSPSTAKRIIGNDDFKEQVLEFLRKSDMDIYDVSIKKVEPPVELFKVLSVDNQVKKDDLFAYQINTVHLVRDSNGKVVGATNMDIQSEESSGTQRIFDLAEPIVDALNVGGVLYIDEFEMNLHSKECELIVRLFMSEENTNRAQLIINTHDNDLMDVIGRNGIHLLSKNYLGETVINPVPSSIRSDDRAIGRKYNKGLLGAVPNVRI
ncbi:MAG: AAA family ATPase [Candidatus Saccharibacteria bacterium]|nr:AAA family ATPase [Candidatus Saccharibacteria bacterium]